MRLEPSPTPEPGQSLGFSHLLIGGHHESTAVTTQPVRMLGLPLDAVHELAARHDELLHAVSSAINQQLRTDTLETALGDLFGSLGRASLDDLADSAEWVELAPGDVLFQQGDRGDALFILVDGILGAWAATDGDDVYLNETPLETYPSPWKLTGEVLNPLKRTPAMHTLPKVVLLIASLSDMAKTEERAEVCDVILAPPVESCSLTDFSDPDGVMRCPGSAAG